MRVREKGEERRERERPSVQGFDPCASSAEIALALPIPISRSVSDAMGEDLPSIDGGGGVKILSPSV